MPILTEPSNYSLRVWAREVIEKSKKKRMASNHNALSQATIDARESDWESKSDSTNARVARALRGSEGQL